jgi:hypothetical protein
MVAWYFSLVYYLYVVNVLELVNVLQVLFILGEPDGMGDRRAGSSQSPSLKVAEVPGNAKSAPSSFGSHHAHRFYATLYAAGKFSK